MARACLRCRLVVQAEAAATEADDTQVLSLLERFDLQRVCGLWPMHDESGQVLFDTSDEQSLLASMLRKLNMNKVVFVGDGRVGKTSLLRLLRGDPFDENEKSTCGVELCTVEVGTGEWVSTDLAAVGDVAGILANGSNAARRQVLARQPLSIES